MNPDPVQTSVQVAGQGAQESQTAYSAGECGLSWVGCGWVAVMMPCSWSQCAWGPGFLRSLFLRDRRASVTSCVLVTGTAPLPSLHWICKPQSLVGKCWPSSLTTGKPDVPGENGWDLVQQSRRGGPG